MAYPNQKSVARKLNAENLKSFDLMIARGSLQLGKYWNKTRQDLRGIILDIYRRATPTGKWSLQSFSRIGGKQYLQMYTRSAIEQFHAVTSVAFASGLRTIRKYSILRHAWLLQQVVPAGRKVQIPRRVMTEASRQRFDSNSNWPDRWSHWIDMYQANLVGNLLMNAINQSDVVSALDEVDATKANTPAATLSDAMERLWDYESMRQITLGMEDLSDANNDVEVEIWRTRSDARDCDDCDDNEGVEYDQAEGVIPLHPNCRCFYQIVPKSFSMLLRSGDANDRELAAIMDARGLVPNSMAVRSEDGGIAAKVIVTFEDWIKGQSPAIIGGIQ